MESKRILQGHFQLARARLLIRDRPYTFAFGSIFFLTFLVWSLSADRIHGAGLLVTPKQKFPKDVASDESVGLQSRPGLFGTAKKRKRLFLKVGGAPQEGFGSSLQFIKDGMRMAHILNMDFAAVKTFDLGQIGFDYNVFDELNRGIDFREYNWNSMCNLHTSVTRFGGHEDFPARVLRLRKEVARFSLESAKAGLGEDYDLAYIDDVRALLSSCDVIIYADQDVHQVSEWDKFTRLYVKNAITKNAKFKYKDRIASPVKAAELHIHYRWGDVVKKIQEFHDEGKWNFNNMDLEHTIQSAENCLQKKLSTNIFMKRSEKMETKTELQKIVAPLRPDATFIEGEDDIVDLLHLSQGKIIAITGGSYSSTSVAIGNPALVIHNGWHPRDYDHLRQWGTPLLKAGESVDDKTCTAIKELFYTS